MTQHAILIARLRDTDGGVKQTRSAAEITLAKIEMASVRCGCNPVCVWTKKRANPARTHKQCERRAARRLVNDEILTPVRAGQQD